MSQSLHFFVDVYEGQTVCEARIVGATSDPDVVNMVFLALDVQHQHIKPLSEGKKQIRERRRKNIRRKYRQCDLRRP